MPSSQYYHISKIMEMIISLKPDSILDIGSGYGKFGVLCREYLELWDGRQKYEFKKRIDCVEVFKEYITPLHRYVYNNIYNKNILDLVPILDYKYDLILLIDVLEHFEKIEGSELLKTLLKNNNGVLISTPKKPSAQKDAFGNIHETHRSRWTNNDLLRLGECYFIDDSISLICYISKSKELVHNFEKNIKNLQKHGRPSILKTIKKTIIRIPGAYTTYKKIK
jgi:SAM-dependent methyltransferase